MKSRCAPGLEADRRVSRPTLTGDEGAVTHLSGVRSRERNLAGPKARRVARAGPRRAGGVEGRRGRGDKRLARLRHTAAAFGLKLVPVQ